MTDEENIHYRAMLDEVRGPTPLEETKFDVFCRILSNVIPWALVVITVAGAIYKCVKS